MIEVICTDELLVTKNVSCRDVNGLSYPEITRSSGSLNMVSHGAAMFSRGVRLRRVVRCAVADMPVRISSNDMSMQRAIVRDIGVG